ncbi:MAG: AbrB/MazE/SpoVT family DNA-binding domain-containing protein [Polaromonas sp.]
MRIPKELGFVDAAQDLEVERVGNTLVLRRVATETIGDLTEILAAFPQSFMAEGREFHEEQERDWSGSGSAGANKAQG